MDAQHAKATRTRNTAANQSSAEQEIRSIVEGWVAAVRNKDVAARTEHDADDVVAFDVVNPLRRLGAASQRQRAEEWFAGFRGPIRWDIRDLQVAASDDVAFCHCLARIRGTLKTGDEIDMWIRSTVGFEKLDGRWAVTHDHGSVPFDPQTGRASLDIEP